MLHHILFLSFLFTLLTGAWSNGTVDRGEFIASQAESSQEKEKDAGEYSEFYYMKGIQISKRLCIYGPTCEEDEVLNSDTLKTSFLVQLTFSREKPDSVLFNGLEGVNTDPRDMFEGFNGGPAAYPECSPSLDCGHARKNGNKLEFSLATPEGRYSGTGTLENDRLILQTQYNYRGNVAEYILQGQKIVGIE